MGQEVSTYTDNLPNIAVVPNLQRVLPHLQWLKPKFRFNKDGFDLERELRKWLSWSSAGEHVDGVNKGDEEENNDEEERDGEGGSCHLAMYEHYRTRIGSPSINRRSFTQDEIDRFTDENDGFPLPSTDDEIKEFDQEVFIGESHSWEKSSQTKRSKKRDRQRSKSATAVPDLRTIRLKLQKLQSPGKPKFIEHLINRVVSKRFSRRNSNGLINNVEETSDVPEQLLSPDSEKCLQQAEAIVEELLTCSRPASGESTDSGKGSLLESTSDFSPTSKRRSWSTPASPTFHGIVKERLKSFQVLNESSDSESVCSQPSLPSPIHRQKSFKNEEFVQEIQEINRSIKTFYCSVSQDESFNSAVMESGYVKALVAKINEHKPSASDKNESENGDTDTEKHKLKASNKEDSGWQELEQELGENGQNDEADGTGECQRSSSRGVNYVTAKSNNAAPTVSAASLQSSSGSASPHEHSRANSVSDSDSHEEDEKPKDKLHQIAHELLTTERTYVARLHLLDQGFHSRVMMENKSGNFLPPEAITRMFSNIKPIYSFHSDFLLPQLEARMQNWSAEQKIGDVMAKLAPFLKIYTEYVKNYDTAMSMIDKWVSQSPKFAALLHEIQQTPECGQLTLQHHMLGPIQRVPRYELLIKDYLKRLEPDATDRPDAQKALELVTEAASHSNTAMMKLDKFHKLLNIIPRLNGEGINDLVSPTRELVKEGPVTKISARSGEKQARYIFLFNDLLLVCSEQMMGSYKIRARLSVEGMEITAGDNQAIQNTFCVKCTEKTVEFLDEANNGQGLDWFATFQQVAADYHNKCKLSRVRSLDTSRTRPADASSDQSNSSADAHHDMASVAFGLSTMISSILPTITPAACPTTPDSSLGQKSPFWIKDEEVTMCMACQDKFTALKRRHHCRACGKVFCAKCSSKKAQLPYDNNLVNRVCQKCHDILKNGDSLNPSNDAATPPSPKPITQTKADEASVLYGYLNVMDKDRKWTRRWITVHDDFAMYFYKKHKDVAAIQTLPLPGHNVKVIGDSIDRPNVFSLTHKDTHVCYFQAESEHQFQQWVRILEKMVILQLPGKEVKRMSTHSDSSSQSNSSGHSSQS